MYCYLWTFRIKYSENFESEIRTKFTENFEDILGKIWGRFSKSIRTFRQKLTNFGFSRANIGKIRWKYIWLIFLQFEKFSVIQVLTYYYLKEILKNFCDVIWKSFAKSLEKNWENFN